MKYTAKAKLKYVLVIDKDKSTPFNTIYKIYDAKDSYSGVHYAEGGLTDAEYVTKRNSLVVGSDGKIVSDKFNGVWLKETAKPLGSIEKTEAMDLNTASDWEKYLKGESDSAEVELSPTRISKGHYGWKAKTETKAEINGYDWEIVTMKRSDGKLSSTVQGGKTKKYEGYSTFEVAIFQDPRATLIVTAPKVVNEKRVREQHEQAVAEFKKMVAEARLPKKQYAKGGGVGDENDKTMREKIAEMNIALNTKNGQVYVGGIKPKNRLFKDENGYYVVEGYGKFMGNKYPLKKHFSMSENEVLDAYMQDKYAKGGEMANGGSIGFIPMELEEKLALIAKWGGTNIKGVIGILNAMIDSGVTDQDLVVTPTKNTRFQRERATEKKIQEIWKRIEPNYKGDFRGNMYYSTLKELIGRNWIYTDLLKKFKPFRKLQKDDSFSKGGETSGRYFLSEEDEDGYCYIMDSQTMKKAPNSTFDRDDMSGWGKIKNKFLKTRQKYGRELTTRDANYIIMILNRGGDNFAKGGDTDSSWKKRQKMFGFKPYGSTKGRYMLQYNDEGQPQQEIHLSKEMAIDVANRYKRFYSNVRVIEPDGTEIPFYAKGGEMANYNGAGIFAGGGGTEIIPPKGELRNADNHLLKYEKNGNEYEFYVYKPVSKLVSGYEQTKHICVNADCALKMNYKQFINYLYGEGYIYDRKNAKGGKMANYNAAGIFADGGFVKTDKKIMSYLKSFETKDAVEKHDKFEKIQMQKGGHLFVSIHVSKYRFGYGKNPNWRLTAPYYGKNPYYYVSFDMSLTPAGKEKYGNMPSVCYMVLYTLQGEQLGIAILNPDKKFDFYKSVGAETYYAEGGEVDAIFADGGRLENISPVIKPKIEAIEKILPKALGEGGYMTIVFAFQTKDGYAFNMESKSDYPVNRATPKLKKIGVVVERTGEKGKRLITIPKSVFDQMTTIYMVGGEFADGGIQNHPLNIQIHTKIAEELGREMAARFIINDYSRDIGIGAVRLIEMAIQRGFISLDEINSDIINSAEEQADESAEMEEIGSSDTNILIHSMLRNAGIEMDYEGNRMVRKYSTPEEANIKSSTHKNEK